ncbi:MAG: hypothetical protein NTU90_05805 [Proteobacteria bacterium]|nr:hypothetical protein [Pseudomonadota bacterium]
MQTKIGTQIDENILKKIKRLAQSEHTSIQSVFEKALSLYLYAQSPKRKISQAQISFGAIALPAKIVQKIAQEDLYEAE